MRIEPNPVVTAHSEEELHQLLDKFKAAGRIKKVITITCSANGRGVNKPLWAAEVEEA